MTTLTTRPRTIQTPVQVAMASRKAPSTSRSVAPKRLGFWQTLLRALAAPAA